jgi:hypothetical protein
MAEAFLKTELLGTQLEQFLNNTGTVVFTGADLRVIVTPTYEQDEVLIPVPTLLNTLNGLTISEHRDVFPVRALGSSNPTGWAYGNRTFAGTLLFAQMGEYGLRDIMKESGLYSTRPRLPIIGLDELPPLDFHITLANEAGDVSSMTIFGVKILDEGESFTIDDNEWVTSASYMAMAKRPLENDKWLVRNKMDDVLPGDHVRITGAIQLALDNVPVDSRTLGESTEAMKKWAERQSRIERAFRRVGAGPWPGPKEEPDPGWDIDYNGI